ncbi:hypothetical protein F959_00481 [Acinetobacter venetianus RAG-1 = CIP 110063]|uniref:Type II secretion system protein H n=1 Tax=Acinetobacter venetianus (strain ATCC 31012 / DSM 23050 / BCRC 14357 / CCUG 45561 / CIP 110063 / KCTC 2702 / LMG 19082 / RAG-1) TaxID=1191460 RepID=N9A3W5_ACIVR|nr:GspH/FimT family protein [Acinetobacter venetianus]ENV38425.1 hypothetical protein F959_00481 [Acinetobacter venetianus RAG-1 = CIP 110063]
MFKNLGFTMSEAIITIAIISIIAAIGIPYFNNMLISNEVNQIKKILTIYIQKAKSDAQIHHKNMTLCASTDLITCSNDWSRGFIGFFDENRNRTRERSEQILYANTIPSKYGTLDWRGTLRVNSVTFQGDTGLPRGSNGSFFYCMNNSNNHLKVILSNMGQIRSEMVTTC